MNKQDYQKLLIDLVSPLKPHYSKNKGRLNLHGHAAWYENISAETEAFCRPLWGLVPFWAGGGNDAELEEIYAKGFASGSDPENADYWGECHDRDQRFVEMASIAYGLLMSPQKVWEPLSQNEKDNLVNWLWQINTHEVCDSNWIFFRVMVNIALKSLNLKYSEERILSDLARIEDFYISNGWYSDGERGQKDYYIAFAIHFYSLIFAKYMENDYPMYAKRFKQRAMDFAQDFIYWFDENGEALPYGRSLTYRFAQVSFWSACLIADIRPFPTGVIKGIIERHLKVWNESNMLDNAGILTVGYKYPNLLMAEHYNAPGSPYWGLKAFAFLSLDDDHEFWSAKPLPLPKLDKLHAIKEADMIISRNNGYATAYVAGTQTNFACGQIVPKYLKFAYSTEFGFNVAKSTLLLDEAACDNMLCFILDGLVFMRRYTSSYKVDNDRITVSWSPLKGINVTTEIAPNECGHIRTHTIISEFDCVAYDCGFAVSSADSDCCEMQTSAEGASAKNNFSSCAVIGGDGHIISAAPNTNLMHSKTVIPSARYAIEKGKTIIKTTIITR